jgi:hypothetical protein
MARKQRGAGNEAWKGFMFVGRKQLAEEIRIKRGDKN